MTVSSTTNRVSYFGNGSTRVFAVPFYFLVASDLTVLKVSSEGFQTTLGLGVDYTVSGAGVLAGGSITIAVAPVGGETIVIYRDPAVTQTVDYQANDPFPAETHERALDKLTMIAQRAKELFTRSVRLSDSTQSTPDTKLPDPAPNNVIGWNSTSSGLQNFTPQSLATIVYGGTAVTNLFSGNGTQTAFTLTVNPGSQANLDVSISGVTQRPNIDYTWVSGTTLTFVAPPPSGTNNILVRYTQALPQTTSDAATAQYLASGTGAVQRDVQTKIREYAVTPQDFGAFANGVNDDTLAIQRAVNASESVFFPAGTYRITSAVSVPSNRLLFGEGLASVIRYEGTTASVGAFYCDSGSAVSYVDGVTICDLKFVGQVVALGFNEFIHLLSLNGVRNCVVERCWFEGFRGDGVYIGSGLNDALTPNPLTERHNVNVTVQNCYFDGINKDNRNGVSVIDGLGITIQDNFFTRTSRTSMPGPIDIEPDLGLVYVRTGNTSNGSAVVSGLSSTTNLAAGMSVRASTVPSGVTIASVNGPSQVTLSTGVGVTAGTGVTLEFGYFAAFHVVRDITVRNNTIIDCGGGVAAIGVYLPNLSYTVFPSGFLIEGNYIDAVNNTTDNLYGFFFQLGSPFSTPAAPAITEATPELGIRIRNNLVRFGAFGRGFTVWNCNDTMIEGNEFIGGTASLLGYPGTNVLDVAVRNNTFVDVQGAAAYAVSVFTGSRITFDGNIFKDCGAPSGAARGAIEFNTGTTSYVDIINNVFTSPGGSFTQQAVRKAGHVFTANTNRFIGNTLIAGTNQFEATTVLNNIPTGTTNTIPSLGVGTNPTTYQFELVADTGKNGVLITSGSANPQLVATDGTVIQAAGYCIGTFALFGTLSNHPVGILVNNIPRLEISATYSTFFNVLSMPAGSASAPAVTRTGDVDTGIFFPAADTFGITTAGLERVRVDVNGNLMVGTTTSNGRLTVEATGSSDGMRVINTQDNAFTQVVWNKATTGNNSFAAFCTEGTITTRGSITYNRGGAVVAYNTTSDYRSKDIYGPLDDSGATIDSLKVYRGKMKEGTIERPMLIAHEAQEVVPYAVTGEKDAEDHEGNPQYQQMDHQILVPLLIAELQSVRARLAALEAKEAT